MLTVDTQPPAVTLTQPTALSNNTRPAFSGEASEATEVGVHVLLNGEEVASAKTTASGGSWSTSGAALSKALPEGKNTFTAYATEKSGLGNAEGKSTPARTFEVNTLPPAVTLKQAQAPPPSKNTRPAFSGEASEATEVVVHVLLNGEEVASAKTTASGGSWSTSGAVLSKALPEGRNVHGLCDGVERAREPRRQEHPARDLRSQHPAAGRDADAADGSVEQYAAGVQWRSE